MSTERRGPSRPTVGLLVDWLEETYQASIYAGVRDVVQEADVNLIVFTGGSLNSPHEHLSQLNAIYDLAGPDTLDGLIIMTGVLGNYVDHQELERFCSRYTPLPTVNVALPVGDAPSVLIENTQGLRDLITHLIADHGYHRIAFIQGPQGHPEAEARYRVYCEVLAEHNLPLDPNLVAPAKFSRLFSARAIQLLLDERGLEPGKDIDAIVAANDGTAYGVLDALQARNVHVPDQVAVTGFDDREESASVIPPLSTVRHPMHQVGRQAAEMLLDLLAGKRVPERVVFPTEMVVRQSCGCLSQIAQQATLAEKTTRDDRPFQEAFAARRRRILNAMCQSLDVSPDEPPEHLERLLDAFVAQVTGESDSAFTAELNRTLRQVALAESDLAPWHGALSALRRHAKGCLADPEMVSSAEDLLQQSRTLISEMVALAQAYRTLQAEQQAEVLRQINETLITTFDIPALMDTIAERLPRVGIRGCYLSLYDDRETDPPAWSRLMLAYTDQGRIELEPEGQRFPSTHLVPKDLLPQGRRYDLLAKSLHFQKDQIGFALFEIGPQSGIIYSTLCRQISSSLKGALLFEERSQAEKALARQTKELMRSNAELEQFAHIASHDLREPLRSVKSYLQLLQRQYGDQIDKEAKTYVSYAVDGAERMQTLIQDLLTYSRVGTRTAPLEPTNCNEIVGYVKDNLVAAIEEAQAQVTHDELPTVIADRTQMMQLFQNLIGNGIKFRGEDSPRVHITAEQQSGHWLFSVTDNGIGIEPQYRKRLFRVFQRLHTRDEYEGSGIGLAVCKKIVERHGGRIWIDPESNHGTTFCFTVPITKPGL